MPKPHESPRPAAGAERPVPIPYNADAVTPAQTLRDGDGLTYRLPFVRVLPGQALRLNSGQIEFGDPPPLRDMPDVPSQLGFLSRHFEHQCGLWAKYPRRFVALYFAFVRMELENHRAEIEENCARYGGLYEPAHWAFSALRPLPRAHLPVGPGTGGAPDLLRAEVAFWTADGPVAIEFVGRGTRGAAEERWLDTMRRAGVETVSVSYEVLDRGEPGAFRDLLPIAFLDFWKDEVLPAGPFRTGPDMIGSMSEPERYPR